MTPIAAPATSCLTLLLAGIALCAATSARADDTPSSAAARFAAASVAPTLALCQLPLRCGGLAPRRRVRVPIWQSSNDANIDERRLEFDGLSVRAYYAADSLQSPPTSWEALARQPGRAAVEVTITSARWPVLDGLRVGMPRGLVERTLGRGGAVDGDACDVYANEATQDVTTVCYAHGLVRSIHWTPEWDG